MPGPIEGMGKLRTTLSAVALTTAIGAAGAFTAATQVRAQEDAQQHAQDSAQDQAQSQAQPQADSAQDHAPACPGHPDAIGTSRTIEVDPAEYQRVGLNQYAQTVPLQDHEVVLTFDDGPLPPSTTRVLETLESQCVKATFFLVGEMARSFPSTVQRIYQDGNTIGTHSEDHPLRFGQLPIEKMRWEIDQGIADVDTALGDPSKMAPFFRIPGFARSDTVEDELAARSLIVFGVDVVADDWRRHITAPLIVTRAMSRLEAKGRGMLLLHDIHPWTATALPVLLKELKDHGFRIVHLVPKPGAAPMIAGRSDMTVAWSATGQNVMDDGSNGPTWPKLTDSPRTDTAELPAPDEGTFDPSYALARAASNGDIEVGAAETPWPHHAPVAPASADAQLPAPSVLDIGWPVKQQPIARVAPVVKADLELRPGVESKETKASEERSERHHGRPSRHVQFLHGHRHGHAHEADNQPGLLSKLAAAFTPAH